MLHKAYRRILLFHNRILQQNYRDKKEFIREIIGNRKSYQNSKKIKFLPKHFLYGLVGGVSGIFMNDDDCHLNELLKDNLKIIHRNDLTSKTLNEEQTNEGWEILHYQPGLKVLRRKRQFGGKELWEYRCIGEYNDISLADFVDAQFDLGYRLSWDSNVSCLKSVYTENYGKKSIIRWVARFPWPMASRLYIYKRLMLVDEEKYQVVLFSKGLTSQEYPDADKVSLRVSNYISTMAVECQPGKGFYDNGINYILTYIDDPEAEIPSHLYNYMVKRSGPMYLSNVCSAAKKLHKIREEKIQKGEVYQSMFTEFLNKNKKNTKEEEEIKDEKIFNETKNVDEVKLRAVAEKMKELAIKSFLEAQNYVTADDPVMIENFRKRMQSVYSNIQGLSSEDKDLLKHFVEHLKSLFNDNDNDNEGKGKALNDNNSKCENKDEINNEKNKSTDTSSTDTLQTGKKSQNKTDSVDEFSIKVTV
uniref:Phosphatidylcholine transfer protein n=1 Tax=Parastrongyloides trichosuri TaxID=131310 RepID=A0A0N4ZB40_PARTI